MKKEKVRNHWIQFLEWFYYFWIFLILQFYILQFLQEICPNIAILYCCFCFDCFSSENICTLYTVLYCTLNWFKRCAIIKKKIARIKKDHNNWIPAIPAMNLSKYCNFILLFLFWLLSSVHSILYCTVL